MSDGYYQPLGDDREREQQMREFMDTLAAGLDTILNGEDALSGKVARKSGFVLLIYPWGDTSGRCNYVSNGANRESIVKMFKEQIRHFEVLKVKPTEPVAEVLKTRDVCEQFAVGRLSREECKRQLIQDCACDPFGLDDLIDAYDPEKQ